MNKGLRNNEFILAAVESLRNILPEIKIRPKHVNQDQISLEIIYRDKLYQFETHIRRNFSATIALDSFAKMSTAKDKILVAPYISRETASLLKKNNVLFLDTVGNAYLNAGDLLVYITHNRLKKKTLPEKGNQPGHRVFYESGLKTIFNLLFHPPLINQPYRTIAGVSRVSLGSVGGVFKELLEMGYLIHTDKNRKEFVNQEELFEKWIESYAGRLRPKLLKGRYRFASAGNKRMKVPSRICSGLPGTFLGGEAAAQVCTGYIKPETVTLYSIDNIMDIIKKLKLVPQDTGPVEILDIFWDPAVFSSQPPVKSPLVPLPLIYADLLISGDPRNLEGAQLLHEKYIQRLF